MYESTKLKHFILCLKKYLSQTNPNRFSPYYLTLEGMSSLTLKAHFLTEKFLRQQGHLKIVLQYQSVNSFDCLTEAKPQVALYSFSQISCIHTDPSRYHVWNFELYCSILVCFLDFFPRYPRKQFLIELFSNPSLFL